MLKRCEDTNLALNWEESHFMVKECIDTDIQEKEQKESQKQQIQARNGKDKVK
ncbi:hypothetical protein Tco_0452140, partial [Tanacetum coccineum]